MRQLLLRRGAISVINVPAPCVEPGHVLVAVAYSLISAGTEISTIKDSDRSLLQRAVEQPEKIRKLVAHLQQQGVRRTVDLVQHKLDTMMPLGYSCAGTVVQVGAGVTDVQIGDRVACAGAGIANHAELVVVPRNLLARVPDSVSLRDASSMTLGAIALQGVRRAELRLGEWATVVGLGLLGQLTLQLLQSSGVQTIGVDIDAERVEQARALGTGRNYVATEHEMRQEIFHLTEGHGVDATIITAASQSDAIVQQAMEFTRPRGRVVVVGAVGLGLQRSPFYEKELDFLIARSYGPGRYDPAYEQQGLDYPYEYVRWTENRNMGEYLRLLGQRHINFTALIGGEYPLDQADQAYAALQQPSARRPIAVVLRYPDAPVADSLPRPHSIVLRQRATSAGRVRIGVVGAGNFAQIVHLPNLQRLADSYDLRAVVSATGSNARAVGERFGADYVTTDYAEVLADDQIDAVLIATRHHLHADQAIQAVRSGKAVLLEKPMALNPGELDHLVAAIKEHQTPFMVGFNRRFSPAARRARAILEGRTQPVMILYRVNAGYLPVNNWIHTADGGGRIIGETCHMFDLLQYLIGPAQVIEVSTTPVVPRSEHILSSDNIATTLRYSDGSVATLLYTALGAAGLPKEYIEIFAGGKILVIDDFCAMRVHGSPQRGWQGATADKGHLEELRVFAAYVRGQIPAPTTLEELVETTQVSFLAASVDQPLSGARPASPEQR